MLRELGSWFRSWFPSEKQQIFLRIALSFRRFGFACVSLALIFVGFVFVLRLKVHTGAHICLEDSIPRAVCAFLYGYASSSSS